MVSYTEIHRATRNSILQIQDSRLWLEAFQARKTDSTTEAEGRERLKVAFLRARDNIKPVLDTIQGSVPGLTVHDISHSDALWDTADSITGADYSLSPVETFVLGVAFLIHDAGMSLPALGGMDALRENDLRWRAHLALAYRANERRDPTEEELENPSDDATRQATASLLRERHAEEAETMLLRSWSWAGRTFVLIEDSQIRDTLGPSIGRVAAFHGAPLSTFDEVFGGEARLGSPSFLPRAWTCDLLKIALLLRVGDAAQVDDRRAPTAVAALQQPRGVSLPHWQFQSRLNRPVLVPRLNALRYEAVTAFKVEEADAWWLAFETLKMVDTELSSADALLRDRRSDADRFIARAVQNVRTPTDFATCFRTSGWVPLDTTVKIDDPLSIVRRLGGEQLYGDDYLTPLREIIQNAIDAVLARKVVDDEFEAGTVRVHLQAEERGWRLSVRDDGLGMDEKTLVDFLLSFGSSFWRSAAAAREFPALQTPAFQPTGRYGLGFFSIFMLSGAVEVISKRFDAGREQLRTLKFRNGLSQRPLLYKDDANVRLGNSNTEVVAHLTDAVAVNMARSGERHVFGLSRLPFEEALIGIVKQLTIASPVAVSLHVNGETKWKLRASEWLELNSAEIFERINPGDDYLSRHESGKHQWIYDLIQPIKAESESSDSRTIGRIGIFPAAYMFANYMLAGSNACIGLAGDLPATRITNFAGVIVGEPVRAARDKIVVDVAKLRWSEWLADQCARCEAGLADASFSHQSQTALFLMQLGILSRRLKIFMTSEGPLSLTDLAPWLHQRNEFRFNSRSLSKEDIIDQDEIVVVPAWSQDLSFLINLQSVSIKDCTLKACRSTWQSEPRQSMISEGSWTFSRN